MIGARRKKTATIELLNKFFRHSEVEKKWHQNWNDLKMNQSMRMVICFPPSRRNIWFADFICCSFVVVSVARDGFAFCYAERTAYKHTPFEISF